VCADAGLSISDLQAMSDREKQEMLVYFVTVFLIQKPIDKNSNTRTVAHTRGFTHCAWPMGLQCWYI